MSVMQQNHLHRKYKHWNTQTQITKTTKKETEITTKITISDIILVRILVCVDMNVIHFTRQSILYYIHR